MSRQRRLDPFTQQFDPSGLRLGVKAYVLGVYADQRTSDHTIALRADEQRLEEALLLAGAIDLDVLGSSAISLKRARPATLIGKGKVDDLKDELHRLGVEVVVLDAALTPAQQRNLERAWRLKVIDRTGLILEIFGRRARTREGSLQVELAHLTYQKSRLVRLWTHLERQRGGHGFLGGPGETQLEHDRRVLLARIVRIKQELEDVKKTRRLQREARQRVPFPVVALVGYTNAGKSTLFNAMTGAQVMAEDMLFATLDPTVRALALPHGQQVLLSDTVGFVSELPTMLVAAFHATLEEVQQAQFILHVRDISHPDTEAQAKDVEATLLALGVDPHDKGHVVEVWNKADKLAPDVMKAMHMQARQKEALMCSALTGMGCDALQSTLMERFAPAVFDTYVSCSTSRGDVLSWLQAKGRILSCETDEIQDVFLVHARLPAKQKTNFDAFCKAHDVTIEKPFAATAQARG